MTTNERHAAYKMTPLGRAKVLLGHARRRAEARGGVCTVTAEQVASAIESGHCQLSGLAFDLSPPSSTFRNPYSPSIDRIDPTNPSYTPENTRIVLTWINVALSDYGLEASMPIIRALAGQ